MRDYTASGGAGLDASRRRRPCPGGPLPIPVPIQYEGGDVRFSFDAVPTATGSRATFYLIVPSYLTAPHTVDLTQILAGLREQLVRIATEETELIRSGAEASEVRQGRRDSSPLDRQEQ